VTKHKPKRNRNAGQSGMAARRNAGPRTYPLSAIAVAAIVPATLIWAYWATITDLVREWRNNDDYSVGQLVPLAAVYLVWLRRRQLRQCAIRPCWWGLALLLAAQAVRFGGLLFLYESMERYSMVLTAAGLVLLIAGREVFWNLRWVMVFLCLMVPLPGRVHNLVSGPLQRLATASSTFVLELAGVTVSQQGNIIVLNDSVPLAVAEACSGLRMLTAFVVVAAVLAFLVRRPAWQKATVLISSIPIAIVCNTIRLCVTAELYLLASSETAERFFHDFAGITMMPLALLLLCIELMLLNRLVLPESPPPHPPAGGVRNLL